MYSREEERDQCYPMTASSCIWHDARADDYVPQRDKHIQTMTNSLEKTNCTDIAPQRDKELRKHTDPQLLLKL